MITVIVGFVALGGGVFVGFKFGAKGLSDIKAAVKEAHDALVTLVSKEQKVQHLEIAKAIAALKKFA